MDDPAEGTMTVLCPLPEVSYRSAISRRTPAHAVDHLETRRRVEMVQAQIVAEPFRSQPAEGPLAIALRSEFQHLHQPEPAAITPGAVLSRAQQPAVPAQQSAG